MERTADMELTAWRATRQVNHRRSQTRSIVAALLTCLCLSALLASWIPLQFSMAALFLFAGPHNWLELRYFMMRLPVRFGRSRSFFMVAFTGIGCLTFSYLSLPALYYTGLWSGANWIMMIGAWNTFLLLWIAALIRLRAKQVSRRGWNNAGALIWPVTFAVCAVNWLAPEVFSLAIVYLHPLVALWFLDRHLKRTRPEWLGAYRRCVMLLPLVIVAICWSLTGAPVLAHDNGLAWRITQHAGAEIFPGVSSHLLVSLHVFLEMLHYGVWLIAMPLIGARNKIWDPKAIPLFRHPRGFPRLILTLLLLGLVLMIVLWSGFVVDYNVTRDVYFAVAIAHVLAEVPFLLRTI